MNILYYFKEKNTLMDQWQRFHIFDELEKHGCNITVYNPLNYATKYEANKELSVFIENSKFDLFMTPHNHEDLFIDTLLKVKQKGIPTLLICFDNLIVPFQHKDIAKHFDLVWLTSRETEKMFRNWNAKVLINPYAANPYFFRPQYKEEIEKIAFIGTPYGSRINLINSITKNKIEMVVHSKISGEQQLVLEKQSKREYIRPAYDLVRFGIGRKIIKGAMKQKFIGTDNLKIDTAYLERKPPAKLEELGALYSNYALSLASTTARNTGVLKNPVNIVNLRSFEIPMSGGLQICSYFDELAEYFEADKEIIFYKSEEEFIEKTKFYLRPEKVDLRMNMKKAARRRAENEHTWFCRFKKVFDYLGLEYK